MSTQANRGRHRGFTLVELLVVICCSLVLIAILTPSLESARNDSRAAVCSNNLKNIAIAIHNYHETFSCLPPGWVSKHRQPNSGFKFGWQVSILPFLGEDKFFTKIDFSHPEKFPRKSSQKRFPIYRCPADAMPDINPLRSNYGTSNYSGNYGTHSERIGKPEPLTNWIATRRTQNWPGIRAVPPFTNGIFYWSSCVRFRDIVDGTSNTFMVGERSINSAAGIWAGVLSNELVNDAVTDCAFGHEINASKRAFSSRHGKGAYFLLCDTSVKFISQSVNSQSKTGRGMGTFQRLSSRNDRQVVGEF